MDRYYSGWELLDILKIKPFQLLDLIKRRKLFPHDKCGQPACRPDYVDHQRAADQITRKDIILADKLRTKAKQGITRKEYEAICAKREAYHKEWMDHLDSADHEIYDWDSYSPELDDKGPEHGLDAICDMLFHEYDLLMLQGKIQYKAMEGIGKDDIELIVKDILKRRPYGSKKGGLFTENDIKFVDEPDDSRSGEKAGHGLSDDEYKDLMAIGKAAEAIYLHIKKAVGVTDKHLHSRTDRKEAALAYYVEKLSGNGYMTAEQLSDLGLYTIKSNKSKRDFMRRLLNRVMSERHRGKRFSGKKLHDTYRGAKGPK